MSKTASSRSTSSIPTKKAHIQKLKQMVAEAKELFLATDEDREGEAISWHLLEVLKPKVPVKRMVFHEITRAAISDAIAHPRALDRRLVDAQEARRILDRLYGYEISPVLWKKVLPRLSAGRVQSVATRIIVEREKARMRFRKAGYWDIEAACEEKGQAFTATLVSVAGKRLVTSRDFDESGNVTKEGVRLDEGAATRLVKGLHATALAVAALEKKPTRRTPAAPFMTSTLQQEAARKLRFSSSRTMRAAQRLYEAGYITYMRTDSTVLSASAVTSARAQIQRIYGAEYLPKEPRVYTKKVKNAQEAHEAIRPAGDVFRLPDEVSRELEHDEAKLYELVWMRTIASQMPDAQGESVQARLTGKAATGEAVELGASGQTITFPGFLRAYVEGSDDPAAELEAREKHLPPLAVGDRITPSAWLPKSHETQPPARFTEASLVQKLEELGVGRPSTYASIMSTIIERGYVWKKGTSLVPSFKAFSVIALLEKHFDTLVDYAFTAKMEDELDAIAEGQERAEPWLSRFYFGSDTPPVPGEKGKPGANKTASTNGAGFGLKQKVADRLDEIDARAINTLSLGDDAEGRAIVVRVGKFGPYLQRGEETASLPEDLPPDELTLEKAAAFLAAPSNERLLGVDPKTGQSVYGKAGRYGAYVQLGDVKKEKGAAKPKTSSLLQSMKLDAISLEDALRLLSLPRVVGQSTEGRTIEARLGPYGPYVSDGKESRSLGSEEEVFTVTRDGALALLAQPKSPMRRARAKEPLKTLGEDLVSKKTIVLRSGKFGFYVTDGETNATLKQGDMPDSISPERAQELLQLRRDREREMGGAPPKPGAKAFGKRGPAKRPTAKRPTANGAKPAAREKPASPKVTSDAAAGKRSEKASAKAKRPKVTKEKRAKPPLRAGSKS